MKALSLAAPSASPSEAAPNGSAPGDGDGDSIDGDDAPRFAPFLFFPVRASLESGERDPLVQPLPAEGAAEGPAVTSADLEKGTADSASFERCRAERLGAERWPQA